MGRSQVCFFFGLKIRGDFVEAQLQEQKVCFILEASADSWSTTGPFRCGEGEEP